jgi:hypothetical protein
MLPRDPSITPKFSVLIMRFIGRIFTSKFFILVINILIAYFIFNLLSAHKAVIQNDQLSYKEILEQFDGMAAILIGWGVALEERYTFRRIFYIIEELDPNKELWLDDICHRYGVGFLVFGLFSEMLNECVRLPDDIIYTKGFDVLTIRLSETLQGICFFLLVLFSYKLLRGIFNNKFL